MKSYLKLIRLPNILMIGLTLALMRYAIVAPIVSFYSMELRLPFTGFMAYVLATMLVAAAGYVINDYYDRDIDILNRKPGNVVVGNNIPVTNVMLLYRILNILALIFAAYASYKANVIGLLVCFPVMIGLLYFYTTTYKKQLLVGNIIVSIATALVPVTVYLFELPPILSHYKYYIISGSINVGVISGWILGFSVFAFLSGLAREIIKDMEDYEGDIMAARNTVPIAWGMAAARWISLVLLALMAAGLILIYCFFFISGGHPDFVTLIYFTAFLLIPIAYNIYNLLVAKTVSDYKFSGDLLKVIMLLGILYAPLVWYIIHNTFDN